MPFNPDQPSHRDLRSIIAEKTTKLVVWVGSGLSTVAGSPNWTDLKMRLVNQLREKANDNSETEIQRLRSAANYAEREANNWIAFQILRQHLGTTSFRTAIRESLRPVQTAPCPPVYKYIWKLGVSGVLNLNLDRLATRAIGEVYPGRLPTEFTGRTAGRFLHSLKSPHPFVANLHGIADDVSSWVFTQSDLDFLLESEGYRAFVQSCITTTTILFIGISADDVAAGKHIEALTQAGCDVGRHYWLTNRTDFDTSDWAEDSGIQIIRYQDHREVIEFFKDTLRFVPDDGPSPPPVVLQDLSDSEETHVAIPEQLNGLPAEELRVVLNARAKQILGRESSTTYSDYEEFCAEYDEQIYQAWYTSVVPSKNKLLGFTLHEAVGQGAFGRVYRATDPDGNQVAIKVLLQEVRQNRTHLQSFRRGVRSMRFLADRNVEGMVAYREASEIPAFVVMEWVDGPTLAEAREADQIGNWGSILKIASEMTKIIRRAHAIPERVLHRDIRPPNIMLEGFYSRPDDWQVVVLDFDLSWHQGALEQSVVQGALAGYLAPEQIQVTAGVSTRHAAVDSFGVGMTLYFMIAGRDPLPAQHKHREWRDTVSKMALSLGDTTWVSLPYRYSRLIIKATDNDQASRWDMSQIQDEIGRLVDAYVTPGEVVSAELVAEELAARGERVYQWDDDKSMAVIRLVSGLVVRIRGDESERKVVVNLVWDSSGNQEHKRVGKWMEPAGRRCVQVLASSGWDIRTVDINPPQSMVIEATMAALAAAKSLGKQAIVLSEVADDLNFE